MGSYCLIRRLKLVQNANFQSERLSLGLVLVFVLVLLLYVFRAEAD